MLHRLRAQQWRSLDALLAIQNAKLRVVLEHAYQQVPFYRDLFDRAAVGPRDIQTAADLEQLPIVSRREMMAQSPEAITASDTDPETCMQLTTSGSSGMPLRVYLSRDDCAAYDMVWTRASLANGQRLWDRVAAFKFNSRPQRWFQKMGIWRKAIIALDSEIEAQIEALRRGQHDILRGNTFQLTDAAREALRQNVTDIRPRLIYSLGSLLSEADRVMIESAFSAPVFDAYGSTECGCMAWECRAREGYHVNVDALVLECIKDGRPAQPGEMGRLVCTSLHATAMPFIRYDTGDVGVLGEQPCSCGRGLPLLTQLNGRADDFFVRPDGSEVSPSVIVNRVKQTQGLVQFQMTQYRRDRIEVDVVSEPGQAERVCAEVATVMRALMLAGVAVEVHKVDAVSPDPSGKIRSMISLLDKEAL